MDINNLKEHDEKTLPKWAQEKLNHLRYVIEGLETYRKMHAVLEDKERDWFTLPNNIEEEISLWILKPNKPFPVCTLYKGDMLFIGRANKSRYGFRLVDVENQNIPIEDIKEAVKKTPSERVKFEAVLPLEIEVDVTK